MTEDVSQSLPSTLPWSIETALGSCKVVDANGVTIAWSYAQDNLATKTGGGPWITSADALLIARWIAKLPDMSEAARNRQASAQSYGGYGQGFEMARKLAGPARPPLGDAW